MAAGRLSTYFYCLFLLIISSCAGKAVPASEREEETHLYTAAEHRKQVETTGKPGHRQEDQEELTVGALYYIWWGLPPGERGMWKYGHGLSPVLGEYSSGDPDIAERHIKWATGHGINLFEVSWSGPGKRGPGLGNDEIDTALREGLLAAPSIGDIKFLLVYETERALIQEAREIGYSDIKEAFVEDILYANERYFDHPSYFKLNGRPVVMVWKAKDALENLLKENGFELNNVLKEVEERSQRDIFWVSLGEDVYKPEGPPTDTTVMGALDGVAPLLGDTFPPGEVTTWDKYLDNVEMGYGLWNTVAEKQGFMFVPSVIPGFDDRAFRHGQNRLLDMDPGGFSRSLRLAKRLTGGRGNWISIYGFNEWFESGAIEPTKEYGLQLLESLKGAVRD